MEMELCDPKKFKFMFEHTYCSVFHICKSMSASQQFVLHVHNPVMILY